MWPIDADFPFAQTAIDGTMNIIRQAEKAGVKKIITTSSIYAVWNPDNSLTDKGTFFSAPCIYAALPCMCTQIGSR